VTDPTRKCGEFLVRRCRLLHFRTITGIARAGAPAKESPTTFQRWGETGVVGVTQRGDSGARPEMEIREAMEGLRAVTGRVGFYLKFYVHQSSFTMMPGSLCLIPFDVL
jgi:hypothetical protein